MRSGQRRASRDEVLNAFAVEADIGSETLKRYLSAYPEFAADLVDLSRELAKSWPDDEEPFSPDDEASIEAGMGHYRARSNPGGSLSATSAEIFAAAARALGLPRQVMAAFRQRRVDVLSVPNRFLKALASALQTTTEHLRDFLDQPPLMQAGRSNKSDFKPMAPEKVTFERLLADAGVSAERRAELLTEDE